LHDGRLVADGTEEQLTRVLGTGPRLRLELRGSSATIEQLLDDQSDIVDWTHERSDDHCETYLVDLEADRREQLVETLVEAGIGLRRLDEAENELERAFLGVTGEADLQVGGNPDGGSSTGRREGR
jgi:ABC-type multidrug transport system ATPase subunit